MKRRKESNSVAHTRMYRRRNSIWFCTVFYNHSTAKYA